MGLAFVRAERHIEAREYARASDDLDKVLAVNPEAHNATLLKIKTDLLCDRFRNIGGLVDRIKGESFKGKLIGEVRGLMERSDRALGEFTKGFELLGKNQCGDAVPHLARAHDTFPESRLLHHAWLSAKAGACFDAKDYDGFLKEAETVAALAPEDPQSAAQVASALAAKYAASGDESFKTRAESRLARAKELCTDADSRKAFAEYGERIEHRLRTREIITKAEYDRRFRAPEGDKK
jgi:tetratricopeptide (TPR) repeat protein